MNKATTIALIVVLALGALVFFWDHTNTTKPIKIGVIVTATGVGAHQGEEATRGITLALEEINASGGINGTPVSVVLEDSKTESSAAVAATQKLIHVDHVVAIIGDSWTTTTAAIESLTNGERTLLLAPLVTLDSLAKDDYLFRLMPKTEDMTRPLAAYAYTHLGSRRVAILRQESPFGEEHARDFRIAIEQLGGSIVADEKVGANETDVRSQLLRLRNHAPDTIFNLHATGPKLGLVMKQAQELSIQTKWLGSWGSENGTLVKEYGNVVDGLTYPLPYDDREEDLKVQQFVEKYRAKYGEVPELTAVFFYDALYILADAMKTTKSIESDVLKKHLLLVQNYKGAGGVISFDKNGDVIKPIVIKEIRNSQFKLLSNRVGL